MEAAPEGRTFTTFNLSVEDHRTYFVGAAAVWVHNEGSVPCNLSALARKWGDVLVKGTKKSIEDFADEFVPTLKALPNQAESVPETLKVLEELLELASVPKGKIDDILDALRKRLGIAPGNLVGSTVTTTTSQLQKKFKHAADFGVSGTPNAANLAKYEQAIKDFVGAATTQHIKGTYRGVDAIINVNPNTGLAVITDLTGKYVSGWKLSAQQLHYVLTSGKLGGG